MRRSERRTKWLTVRLTADEEKTLLRFFDKATSGSLSEYARDLLLKEPVTILYRNASADDFLAEMLQLKAELKTLSTNLTHLPFTTTTNDNDSALKAWLLLNEAQKRNFLKKLEEINERMAQIHEAWLQK